MKFPFRSKQTASASAADNDRDKGVRVSTEDLLALQGQGRRLTNRTGRIQALQAGNYLSKFKGRGMEFDEVRLYHAGDDLRSIDWRVTARTGRAHTKLFREERERPVQLWVDYRAPMFFATRGSFKAVIAAKAAALLAWSAIARGDRLGGLVFSEQHHLELRPRQGKSAVLHFIRQLVDHPAWQENMPGSQPAPLQWDLAKLRHATRPGSSIYLLSDFRNLAPDAQRNIAHLARHNEMTLIFIYDPLEAELPPAGQYRLASGDRELLLDTASQKVQQGHNENFHRRHQQLVDFCRQHRMTLITCATTDDPATQLQAGLQQVRT